MSSIARLATTLVALAACVEATPPAAMPPPAPAPAAKPRPVVVAMPTDERWLTPDSAAKLHLIHAIHPTGYLVAAKVGVDEQHGAHLHAPRSGIVASISAKPGLVVKAGVPLLVVDTAGTMAPIKAPIAGEVISIDVGLGDAVTGAERGKEATELLFLADLDRVMLTAMAPTGVQSGASASFRTDSLPGRVFAGRVSWISQDRSQLRCAMDNYDRTLRLGVVGTMLVEQAGAPGLSLPRSSLVEGNPVVLVKRGSAPNGRIRFVETPVAIAFDGGAGDLTVTGLSPDDEVVADASTMVRDNSDVGW